MIWWVICENRLRIGFRNAIFIQVKIFCIFWNCLLATGHLATSKTSRASMWTFRTQRNISVLVPLIDGTSSCPWSGEPLESYQVTHRTATSTSCSGNQASVFDLQRNTFKMRLCENTNNKASTIILCIFCDIRNNFPYAIVMCAHTLDQHLEPFHSPDAMARS